MNGYNKVILAGHLGQEPEIKTFQDGGRIANISIATSEKWNDQNGNKQERTDWHRIEVSGKLVEVVEKYLSKGDAVLFEGKLRKDTWQTENGENRSLVKVRATGMQMLGGKVQHKQDEDESKQPTQEKPAEPEGGGGDGETDDLPFRRNPNKRLFSSKFPF